MKNKMSQEEVVLASQLRRRGIPLDEKVVERMQATWRRLSISQTGTCLENAVFDLDSGETGYMLSVVIYNNSNQVVSAYEFLLEMLWFEPEFHWLEDPWRKVPREYAYSFPKHGPAGFERDVVLNHCLGRKGRINPGGDPLDGLLLGVGQQAIPEEYHHGQWLQTRLFVFDQRGNRYQENVRLFVDRRAQLYRRQRQEKLAGRYKSDHGITVP